MKFRSHRGGVYYTPENTMPAFKAAFAAGYEMIETDPQYTKDGVVVLMHDGSVFRTCLTSEGERVRNVIIAEHTYEELMQYDAGLMKGEEFRGTKIPRLDELLELLDGSDVILCLDKKIPTDNMDGLFDVVAKYNVRVMFYCEDIARIETVLKRFPEALIGYDGVPSDEMLTEVTRLVPREQLQVWVYLDRPNFAWLDNRRKASEEVCRRIKKYAELGIANVNTADDVREAYMFDPDIIEV